MATGGDGPAPEATPATVLRALHDTDLNDDQAAEALRVAHCALCRSTQGMPEEGRRGQCDLWRCGLRNPRKLWDEGALLTKLGQALDGDDPGDARRALSLHIWQCAAVTPGLGQSDAGDHARDHTGPTLRAALHLAMILYFARQGGDLLLDANEWTGDEAGRLVSQRRYDLDQTIKPRAVADRRAGMSLRQVAEKYGRSKTTIDRWCRDSGVPVPNSPRRDNSVQ